jgi:hypothetical protein
MPRLTAQQKTPMIPMMQPSLESMSVTVFEFVCIGSAPVGSTFLFEISAESGSLLRLRTNFALQVLVFHHIARLNPLVFPALRPLRTHRSAASEPQNQARGDKYMQLHLSWCLSDFAIKVV